MRAAGCPAALGDADGVLPATLRAAENLEAAIARNQRSGIRGRPRASLDHAGLAETVEAHAARVGRRVAEDDMVDQVNVDRSRRIAELPR